MEPNLCAICGNPMDFVQAGISKKTGRAYNGFWACPQGHKQPRATTPQPVSNYPAPASSPWDNRPTVREPLDTWQPGNTQALPDRVPAKVWDDKDLRIARESALKSIAEIMEPVQDPVAATGVMIQAADILVDYIYKGMNSGNKENLSAAELNQIGAEIDGR